ncbi:MAG: tRNA pseudouridine(55) synthase TruB [Holosporaceae bacterium]|jgi:tRNA pseudouridine55 synthase|nr:tRNA pseudouridine(55) synthase TruB [Holosporaceae bacterium]
MRGGWICLDKPGGISSNKAMLKVRAILEEKKTGYLGTLDPFATGVLPVAVGEARKYIRFVDESQKCYVFTVVFGKTTDTLDETGKVTATVDFVPDAGAVSRVIPEFIGEIRQTPPQFSAVKIDGRRACDRVRRGEIVSPKPRSVRINDLRIIAENFEKNEMTMEVTCSGGTYVRSLARDLAEKLGSLACVKTLRRNKSGFFSVRDAISLEKLREMKDTGKLADALISVERPLDDIPALYLGGESVSGLRNGVAVPADRGVVVSSNVRIFDDDGIFRGIGFVSEDGLVKPVRMGAYD